MKSYKERQYLVFDFEDGKNVKYDLSTSQMIGKKGKPVKGLCGQLSGYKIEEVIESFQDEKYKDFLNYVYKRNNNAYWYANVGTFLKKIKPYSHFEQYFAIGFTNIAKDLKYKMNDIPKGLIKLCLNYDLILTNGIVSQYKIHQDILENILKMEFMTITKNDIINCILNGNDFSYATKFNDLVIQHKYKYDSLLKYIDNLMTYEAIDYCGTIISELKDYANMMSKLSNKFEKYPKNFLTTHKIACRNYNRLKQQFSEELFLKIRDENLEFKTEDYQIIYPKSTQEIKDEACQQQNCLASYIQKVLDEQCHILFLRKKDSINKSLVTLEIRNLKVVQSKGKFNRDLTNEEQEIINKYNEKLLKLKNGGMKDAD